MFELWQYVSTVKCDHKKSIERFKNWKARFHQGTFELQCDRRLLTCGPAASWSVQSGLDEILGRLLLEGRRRSLFHRRHRVVSLQTDKQTGASPV